MFSCPKNLMTFLLVVTLYLHIRFLNSTPLKLSLLPRPPFSCHPTHFISPNSAPSLQELLPKNLFVSEGGSSEPSNPPGSAPGLEQVCTSVLFVCVLGERQHCKMHSGIEVACGKAAEHSDCLIPATQRLYSGYLALDQVIC